MTGALMLLGMMAMVGAGLTWGWWTDRQMTAGRRVRIDTAVGALAQGDRIQRLERWHARFDAAMDEGLDADDAVRRADGGTAMAERLEAAQRRSTVALRAFLDDIAAEQRAKRERTERMDALAALDVGACRHCEDVHAWGSLHPIRRVCGGDCQRPQPVKPSPVLGRDDRWRSPLHRSTR